MCKFKPGVYALSCLISSKSVSHPTSACDCDQTGLCFHLVSLYNNLSFINDLYLSLQTQKKHFSFPESINSVQAVMIIILEKITQVHAGGRNLLQCANGIRISLCCFSQCASSLFNPGSGGSSG